MLGLADEYYQSGNALLTGTGTTTSTPVQALASNFPFPLGLELALDTRLVFRTKSLGTADQKSLGESHPPTATSSSDRVDLPTRTTGSRQLQRTVSRILVSMERPKVTAF